MEFGFWSAMFGISGVKFSPFPGIQNNAFAYKLYLGTSRGISHRSAPTTHPDTHPDIAIIAIRSHASSQIWSVLTMPKWNRNC